ncbi:MAG: calcium/sodium antiporter [Lachnospiraceae bacterium]|nr:calcium/sodium antiporter [Lachnospiraceae bacterium]
MFGLPAIVVEVFLFIVGLICLVKGGDWFVDGATGIAHKFHMPEILIGATVVSIGTTIPEVMVSSTAALTAGASDMAYGNAIGSIICNTALIAAITMTFRPAAVEKKSLKMPIAFFFGAAALYIAVAYATGFFSRIVGIILLAIFIAYMIMCVKQAKESMALGRAGSDGAGDVTRSMPGLGNDSGSISGLGNDSGSISADDAGETIGLTQSPIDPEASRMTEEYIQNVLNRDENSDLTRSTEADGDSTDRNSTEGDRTSTDQPDVVFDGSTGDSSSDSDGGVLDRSVQGGNKNPAGTDAANQEDIAAKADTAAKDGAVAKDGANKDFIIFIAKLILGAAVIAIGANLLVDNGTLIAEAAGVPQSVIALTFVALGTSLPELVTAITSLVKGHSDLSLGNVIGANLFNLVLVSGLAVTLAPFHIPVEKTIAGINASLVVDIPVMVAVMLIMCLPALIKGRIYRAQGIGLLAIYFSYVIFQFV